MGGRLFHAFGGFGGLKVVFTTDDFAAGFFLQFASGVAGDGAALFGGDFVFGKALRVLRAGDLRRGGFAEHGEDQLQIGHVVAEVLPFQALMGGVFGRGEAEGGLGDFGGEDGVFELLLHAAFLPLAGQLVANGDAAHALLDPGLGVAFGEVEGPGAFAGELGVFDFLHALKTDLGEPAFEGFGLWTGDGLDEAENALGVPAGQFLGAAGGGELQRKGGGKLPPPFEGVGQSGVATAHVLEVAGGVGRVGEGGDDIDDYEPPFVGVKGFADFLFLKKGDAGFHGEGFGWLKPAHARSRKRRAPR